MIASLTSDAILHDCMCDFRCNFKTRSGYDGCRGRCEQRIFRCPSSLEEFFHKALKDEQKECIRRILSLKEDVLAILPTGFGKSVIKLLNSDWLTLKA